MLLKDMSVIMSSVLEPWNDATLLPPPVLTSTFEDVDVQNFKYTFNNISNVLSKQSPLHKESAILSRFLYKFDKKFRNDIGYRNFRKVNSALRKYLNLNLIKDIENFVAILPESDDENYLPSRQMLEYIMVRLITFTKIMLRVCVCSKHAAVFYLDRVKRGEGHWMSLMPYSVLSRIWTMSKVLLQHSCTWYSTLHPYLNKLNKKGLDFLPDTYKLPDDLEKWMNLENVDLMGRLTWSQKKCRINIDPAFEDDEEADRFKNVFDYLTQMNDENKDDEPVATQITRNCENINSVSNKKIDLGEAVSRNNYTRLKEIPLLLPMPRINHAAERVTNKDTLISFITTEEKLRIEGNKQSLTSHLSFMQWQTLKKSLLSLYETLAKDRKIQRKFLKLWKEKCLDYKCDEE